MQRHRPVITLDRARSYRRSLQPAWEDHSPGHVLERPERVATNVNRGDPAHRRRTLESLKISPEHPRNQPENAG